MQSNDFDIVSRLRRNRSDIIDHFEMMIQAADEIERLRNALEQRTAERDTWRNLYDTERGNGE